MMKSQTPCLALTFLTASLAFGQTASNPDVNRVLHFNFISTQNGMTNLLTAIRTVADVPRVTLDANARTVSLVGPASKIAMVDWLFAELDKPVQSNPLTVTYEYQPPEGAGEVMKIFFPAHRTSSAELAALTTTIRTVADTQRIFPLESIPNKALVLRASRDRTAMAEWMLRQLDQPASGQALRPQGPDEFQWQGNPDGLAKVFFLARSMPAKEMGDFLTGLRTATKLQRVFMVSSPPAVVLRGTPEQVAQAGQFILDHDKAMQ